MQTTAFATSSSICPQKGTNDIKTGLAKMLKGGVIMDVTNASEAEIAQKAGACAVMALHKVPADIIKEGGIARMADPLIIQQIQKAVSIPVMAKVRIGHFVEAQILQQIGVDFIDESEVLTPASQIQISKHSFTTPFVCGCRNLREALRAISKGASMIRTKGNAGTGNVAEAVKHLGEIKGEIASLSQADEETLKAWAREAEIPLSLLQETLQLKRLPVVTFAAGGIATPADAALMMQLGSDGIFVGSGIFKSKNPLKMAKAIVSATTNYQDASALALAATDTGEPMK